MKQKGEIIIKKLIFISCITLLTFFNPSNIYASDTVKAKIGNNFYDNLEEAINASNSNDVISLLNNVKLSKPLQINKNVNINLNNHIIEADEKVFLVEGGSLNLKGSGTIREIKPNYGAIVIKGSTDQTKKDFSTISIEKGITLEGWSGIFINHNDKTAYGIRINMNGKINAINDTNGNPGAGIYVNGNIYNKENSPIINLGDTVKITSTGTGIYAAGYANYYINGAYIEGKQSGLGIKSGYFNILDGTIIGSDEDKTPTTGNNNGISPSGAAIQIESNPGYTGNVELNIKNGTINSKNSHVIYEYTVNDGLTSVENINISGGTYISNANKSVFLFSDHLKNTHKKFISGGIFSSDPTQYLKSGHSISLNEDLYEVVNSTISTFNTININNSKIPIIIIIILFTLSIFICFYRTKIFNYINLIKK